MVGGVRLALLDNTINASYIFAKLLRRSGYAADLIQQPNMPFNHQPVWEDIDAAASADEIFAAQPRDDYWRDLEARHGWQRPDWVRRPRAHPRDLALVPGITRALGGIMPLPLVPMALALTRPTLPILSSLGSYDYILVVGPSAGSAYLAKRPYAVITMGWDVFTLPFWTDSPSPVRRARAHLQRAALRSSRGILCLPTMDQDFLRRLGLKDLSRAFPIPVDVDGYAEVEGGSRAEVFGADNAARMEGKTVYFCPSRISFAEKGQDLLLRAFAEVRAHTPAFLVLLGWGHEVTQARELIAKLGVAHDVCVLPSVFSKKRLIRAFRVTDVATVQFILGGYGGVAREALAAGVPVVSSYDPAAPQPHPATDPAPIVSASTVETIRDAMLRLTDAALRRDLGRRGHDWARRRHQEAPLEELERLLGESGLDLRADREAAAPERPH